MNYADAADTAVQITHFALSLLSTIAVMGGIGFGGAWVVEKRFDPSRY